MEDIITLIGIAYTKNAIGEQIATETKTEVFATVTSATRAEWAEVGQMGLQPSFVFYTPAVNYDGERIVEYHGRRYGVYRTYHNRSNDEMEIYVEEKVGENGQASQN